jgi:hypothetical protein
MTAFNSAIRLTNHPSTFRSGAPPLRRSDAVTSTCRQEDPRGDRGFACVAVPDRLIERCGLACLEDPDDYADT